MQIQETSALVTGGSRGLGKALGSALAARGARVVLVARGEEELARTTAEIRAATNGEVHGIAFDVGRKEDAHRIAGAAAGLVGPIDLLVHCASTLGPLPMPLLADTACEDLAHVLEVNLVGPFRLTKIVAGAMALRGRGTVLFTSSDAAVEAYPRWGAYSVSKAAQDHLARVLAVEMPEVRFFAFDPGEMDTRMHADAMPDADRAALARPEAVAERLVRFLAEEEPSAKSGARLALGGL